MISETFSKRTHWVIDVGSTCLINICMGMLWLGVESNNNKLLAKE